MHVVTTAPRPVYNVKPVATKMTRSDMAVSWEPVPTSTDSAMGNGGTLNTSPCTCFHPDSSMSASKSSASASLA